MNEGEINNTPQVLCYILDSTAVNSDCCCTRATLLRRHARSWILGTTDSRHVEVTGECGHTHTHMTSFTFVETSPPAVTTNRYHRREYLCQYGRDSTGRHCHCCVHGGGDAFSKLRDDNGQLVASWLLEERLNAPKHDAHVLKRRARPITPPDYSKDHRDGREGGRASTQSNNTPNPSPNPKDCLLYRLMNFGGPGIAKHWKRAKAPVVGM